MTRILILIWLAVASSALAITPTEMFDDPEQEARARAIGQQLRCVLCRNQSIFDSNAGIAHDLRRTVRERMTAGDTDAEVLAYIQARYGDYVLLKPPVDTHTYILWSAPFLFLFLGAGGAGIYLRNRARALPDDVDHEEAVS